MDILFFMMSNFFWIVIVVVVVSLGWWALIAFVAFKAAHAFSQHFEMQVRQIIQLAEQQKSMPPAQRAAAQAQLLALLNGVAAQRPQLGGLAQQRYDLRVGELMGVAANAGIPWSPPR